MILWVDFETRSHCDLISRGGYNYAQDASTEVLCMSYAFDDGDVTTWTPDQPFPDAVRNFKGQIRAHNAAFERLIFWYVLQINFDLTQFYCTATQARANCLPASLEDIGRALSSNMRKDHRGKQLIRLMCIPPFNTDPTLMAEMINYCEQDVKVMRTISGAMRQLSDDELADYHVSERINDRGILIDVPLAKSAIQYASAELEEIQALVADITQGEITSVRSPKMRQWVQDRVGEEALKLMWNGEKYSIDKTVRANLLALAEENPDEVPNEVADVIQSADDLWASSVAKFNRLSQLADEEDNRLRGAFVFAGGSATGRAASYGAQIHNLTRKCAKDPAEVRQAMVRGHAIVPKFGRRITDVLKGMLRPAIIPAEGKSLVVADWAAIEARCNPWLSNDKRADEVLDVFRSGRDIYIREAAAIFHVPEAEVGKDKRQIGKIAILSCFTAKTKVLTDNGVKDIVDVLLTDKLWDGISWVDHQGLVSRGKKEVINVCGMFVTADHLLKVKHDWLDAKTVLMSKSTLTLALATGSANLPFLGMKSLRQGLAVLEWLSFNALVVQSLIKYSFITYLKAHLRGVMFALKNNRVFGVKIISNMLRLAPMMNTAGAYSVDFQRVKIDAITLMTAPTRTMEDEESFCLHLGGLIKQRFYAMWLILKAGIYRVWNWTGLMLIKGMSLTTLDLLLEKKTSITEGLCKKCNKKLLSLKPVYDILNSGVNHRFTVITDKGALLVHNCGFGGGLGAFGAMSRAYGLNLAESDARRTVDAWRRANQWAVNYWQKLEEAYTRAMRNKGKEFSAGRVTYLFDGNHLWYALPSSRVLCYPYAKLDLDGVTYAKASWKPSADAKEWPRARLWKGLACENITQAVANDILRHSLRQLDDVVLHVHDEIVIETSNPDAISEQLKRVMCSPPSWAEGLPLDVEVSVMSRYGK